MPLQRVPINNFRGGLNTRDSPFELQPNESPDLLNVTLTALVGQLRMRAGKMRFDTGGLPFTGDGLWDNPPNVWDNGDTWDPQGPIDHAKQIVLGTSNRFLMLSINGSIYSCNPAGSVVRRFIGTAGTVWSFEQYVDATGADMVWCMNGTDSPQKWNGAAANTSAWAGSPPNGTILKAWRDRMLVAGVAANNQRLYFSPFGDPELTTGAIGFIDIRGPEDEKAAITELNVLGDRLYAFKSRSVTVVQDPVSFANRRLGEPGCSGRFQSHVMEEKLYFFNEQGIWSTGGVAVSLESGSITNYFPRHLNYAAIDKVRLVATQDSYPRLLVTLPIDNSLGNNVMIELVPHINFRRIGGRRYLLLPALMLHSFDASCLANFKVNGAWGVYGGSTSQGKLYKYFAGVDDDGVAIVSKWQSAWMAIQGEEPFERVRRFNVELSGDAAVDVYKDFSLLPDFSATLPNPTQTTDLIWDNPPDVWDDGGPWDPAPVYRFVRVRPESRGRFHSVRFRSLPGGLPFQINAAELAIRGGKEHT